MSESWTTLKLIQWTSAYFEKAGIPNPRLDAELLLAHVLRCKRIDLYTRHEALLREKHLADFKELIRRRTQREPLQYIIGETEFYGLRLKVTPAVLIPRPETELLVEEALKTSPPSPLLSKERGERGEVLEIGTGSGCIAIALAKHLPEAKVVATDISKEALEIAAENAKRHEVSIEWIAADIAPWKRFTAEGRSFDLIVSNPPYIATGEFPNLQPEVRDFEPRKALDGGPEGLKFIRQILAEAPPFLKPGGWLLMEIGEDQTGSLKGIEVKKDLSGCDRILKILKRLPAGPIPGTPPLDPPIF